LSFQGKNIVVRKLAVCLTGFLLFASAHSASVDGINIYSIDVGQGPAVVFVHGGYVNMSYWDAQLNAFADDFRVLALDLPGHGLSESPPNDALSYEFFARAVEAVREEAGVEEIVLVGHSMGGLVIRQYMSMFPEHVAALVAADVPLDLRGIEESPEPPASPTLTLEMLEMGQQNQFVPETPVAVKVRVLELMAPGILSGSPDLFGLNRRAREAALAGEGFSRFYDEVIEVPTLHVFAESSEGTWNADTIRQVFPNSRFETISDTSHFLIMEKPEEFNRIVREFLENLDF
jgi:pimeloyl-ACP methyl ester carboxylesterase